MDFLIVGENISFTMFWNRAWPPKTAKNQMFVIFRHQNPIYKTNGGTFTQNPNK